MKENSVCHRQRPFQNIRSDQNAKNKRLNGFKHNQYNYNILASKVQGM